jgi:hypothetical protein
MLFDEGWLSWTAIDKKGYLLQIYRNLEEVLMPLTCLAGND